MDITALFNLTYGLYIVGAMDGERPVGCTINTCFQVTSENPILAISLSKNNYTLEAIRKTKRYSLSIVAEDTDNMIIATFGFRSSRDTDKYDEFGYRMLDGAPVVNGKFCSRLILDAIDFVDCETHVIVLGRLVDTVKEEGKPMTYEYYHRVVKGKAPKNAPTFVNENPTEEVKSAVSKNIYKCELCGYEIEFDGEIPADYQCPLCGADSSLFSKL